MLFRSCVTTSLWEEDHFGTNHEPATPANVRLYRKNNRHLIVYDERKDDSNLIKRRAYWVNPEIPPPPNPHQPHFVSLSTTNALEATAVGITPEANGWSAVNRAESHEVTLYEDAVRRGNFDLPVYHEIGRAHV